MTAATQSTSKASARANNPAGDAGGYAFRAPRYGDLVACPYCETDTFKPLRCDHCGDEGILFASEVFQ